MLRLSRGKQQCLPPGEAIAREHLLDRGAIPPQFYHGIEPGDSQRSALEPAFIAPSRSRGRRKPLSLGRMAIFIQERSRLENRGRMGKRQKVDTTCGCWT